MENKELMKQLGISVTILLLFGMCITIGFAAAAELTADQQVQPSTAAVGETAMVTLMLSYNGNNGTQVTVTPGFTPGISADSGPQTDLLAPGSQQMISYPIRAERSGSYWITSLISYTDDGAMRQLSKESPFTAMGGPSQPEQQPGSAPIPSQPVPTVPEPVHVKPAPIDNGPNDNGPIDNGSVPPGNSPVPPEPAEQPANKPAPSGNASV
jgi:hypothetical protein